MWVYSSPVSARMSLENAVPERDSKRYTQFILFISRNKHNGGKSTFHLFA